jgi:Disulphide bond corrector protein DsbC/Carboxypeptidase regulatory-like domain
MAKTAFAIRFFALLILTSIGTQFALAARAVPKSRDGLFSGTIVDREGVGISDASVLVEGNSQSWNLRGDDHGRFHISLPDGVYRFTIERSAFKQVVVPDFVIAMGAPSSHEFQMDIDNPICTVTIIPATGPDPEPNIGVNSYFASDRAQRGRTVQAAVVMDIPAGYHVNSNRPMSKYSIPTVLKIEASNGVTVSPVIYPRAIVRKLKASNNEPLAVYEGRAILRFNLNVSANYQGSVSLKLHLKFQSCNDEVCFPPKTEEMNMGIDVVGPNDRVQRTNGWVFGR